MKWIAHTFYFILSCFSKVQLMQYKLVPHRDLLVCMASTDTNYFSHTTEIEQALFKLPDTVKMWREREKKTIRGIIFACLKIPFEKKKSFVGQYFTVQKNKKSSIKEVPNGKISTNNLSGNTSQIKLINVPCNNQLQVWFVAHWMWTQTNTG